MNGSPSSSRPPYRPTPRQGQPMSSRNFAQSSAGGVGTAPRLPTGRPGNVAQPVEVDEGKANKAAAWGASYVTAEDSIRNDYSTHYVRTGERPQNHLRGADLDQRYAEYPKLESLLLLKHSQLGSPSYSIPPTYLETPNVTPSTIAALSSHRFDVILLSPPPTVTFEELRALDLGELAESPGFVWLWVGSGQKGDGIGLEKGRELIASWGYRRSEDIVWLKTNKTAPANDLVTESTTLFTPTVEHCLMGMRGTVRRSTDPWFVHCNVDTDVMVWEGDANDHELRPPELQSLVENFCQGTRRLHLFGSPHSLRRGWLTVGPSFAPLDPLRTPTSPIVLSVEGEETAWGPVPYSRDEFEARFARPGYRGSAPIDERTMDAPEPSYTPPPGAPSKVPTLLPYLEELDALRPKSPPLRNGQPSSGGLGRGRGAGLGVTRSAALPSSAGSRGPPSNRGGAPRAPPPPPPPVPQYSPYYPVPQQGYQQQGYYPQPPGFVPSGVYFPPPGNAGLNRLAQQFGFLPTPLGWEQQHQLFQYQEQQARLFNQWVGAGGAGSAGASFYPTPRSREDAARYTQGPQSYYPTTYPSQ